MSVILCPGGSLSRVVCRGGVFVQGGLCQGDPLLPVDRQKPVKMLPWPKLRLRAVLNCTWSFLNWPNQFLGNHEKWRGRMHPQSHLNSSRLIDLLVDVVGLQNHIEDFFYDRWQIQDFPDNRLPTRKVGSSVAVLFTKPPAPCLLAIACWTEKMSISSEWENTLWRAFLLVRCFQKPPLGTPQWGIPKQITHFHKPPPQGIPYQNCFHEGPPPHHFENWPFHLWYIAYIVMLNWMK